MSMLEDIKAAEAAAVDARKDATVSARNLLHDSEVKANNQAKTIIGTAREAAKAAISDADAKARQKAQALMEQSAGEERNSAEKARQQLPKAVAYIVEKVVI